MSQKIIIPGRLPSFNEYIDACRSHPQAGAKMKKRYEADIGWCIRTSDVVPVESYPVTIAFKWFEKDGRRDLDNICFAKKFVLDALVGMGILSDDSRKYVGGFTDTFPLDKDNPRIEVEILEENDD